MLTRAETQFLKLVGSPPWEKTDANKITVWRGRIGTGGTLIFYLIYAAGNALFPASLWYIFAFGMNFTFWGGILTDLVDGQIARTVGEDGKSGESKFGRFADPTADKLIEAGAFIIIAIHFGLQWWLLAFICIVAYDFGVIWMRSTDEKMRTLRLAKVKQVILNLGLAALLFSIFAGEKLRWGQKEWQTYFDYTMWIGSNLIWITVGLCCCLILLYKYREIGKRIDDALFGWIPFSRYIWP